ncbi:MAG: putative HNHc nuclease [Clostridia bacterium]
MNITGYIKSDDGDSITIVAPVEQGYLLDKRRITECEVRLDDGRNRRDILHRGMMVLPLSRIKHSEAHTIGKKSFEDKYHVFGIRLDDELCRIWKVRV